MKLEIKNPDILDLNYKGKTYKGLSQNFFENKKSRNNSCAVISAANNLLYIEQFKYGIEEKNDKEILEYINILKDLISPSLIGKISVKNYIKKIVNFYKDNQVELGYELLSYNDKNFNYFSALSFIHNGIMRNSPIIVFSPDLFTKDIFRWHWMNIVGLVKDKNNKYQVVIYTWGSEYKRDFQKLYDSVKKGGSLLYFYLK